jgi:hypothetical protein
MLLELKSIIYTNNQTIPDELTQLSPAPINANIVIASWVRIRSL